mgnify:FL=1
MIINFQGHKMGIISKFFSLIFFSALLMISSSVQSQNLSGADSLLSENRFSEAIEILENALQVNPDNEQLKGKMQEARQLKQEAEKKYASALQQGQKLMRQEKYPQARQAFREALKHNPDASYPKLKLDEIKKLYEDPQEERAFQRAVEKADAHMNNFRYEAALEQYQKALEIKPRNVEALKKVKQVKSFIEKQKERDSDYQQYVKNAENYFEDGNYERAMLQYQEALLIKPDKNLPKNKIEEIRGLLDEERQKTQKYEARIEIADSLYMSKQFSEAKEVYRQALTIKPSETYPVNMIRKIDPNLEQPEPLNKEYIALIEQADLALRIKDYDEAREMYRKALEINPNEDYPQQKLDEISDQLAKAEKRKKTYQELVRQGEDALANQNYTDAQQAFEEAAQQFSDSTYPQEQIARIDRILASKQANQQRFDSLTAVAENQFRENKLDEALASYRQAKAIFPEKGDVNEKIREINNIMANQQEKEEQYQSIIASADSLFDQSNFQEATASYREAQNLKPEADYPKERIQEVEKLIAQNEKEAKYNQLISSAESAFEQDNLPQARSQYEEASEVYADSAYPREQIARIDRILASKQANQQRFDSLTAVAENQFRENKLDEALASYRQAKAIFPEKGDVNEKIREINNIMANQQEKEEQYQSIIASADSLFDQSNFQEATASYREAQNLKPEADYPKERIQEVEKLIAQNEKEAKYNQLISSAESAFEQDNLLQARSQYEEASKVYADSAYPREQIASIERIIAEREARELRFDSLINVANRYYEAEEYNNALSNYEDAKALFPNNDITEEKIREIDQILDKQEALEKEYAQVVRVADSLYDAEAYQEAILAYQEAQEIISERDYPSDQIAKSMDVMANIREEKRMYNRAIEEADSLFAEQDYINAITSYNNALLIKENDNYAKNRIKEAQHQIEQREKSFKMAMELGNAYLEKEEYQKALNEFEKALALKEENEEALQKRNETQKILEKIRQEMLAKYNVIIEQADAHYENKDFSKAIEQYEKAASVNPEADYPEKRISDIREWLAEHSLREVVNQTMAIDGNSEKKFDFQPITYRDRSNNYIVLTARRTGGNTKIFLNYGAGDQRHGGVVISNVPEGKARQFVFNLTDRRSWRENENNWISVYTQGGGISIKGLDISKGD